MQRLDERPPYVTFEVRPVEDRAATEASGHWIGKDAIFAMITPSGSKDKIEKLAEQWIKDLREQVRQDRFPAHWLEAYERALDAFKRNEELPEDGFPIKEWPVCSPAQRQLLLSLSIRTVEALAELNESGMTALGMGGRDLKEKAKAFLEVSKNDGKTAKELSNLRQDVIKKESQITELMERLTKAESTINTLKKSMEEDA